MQYVNYIQFCGRSPIPPPLFQVSHYFVNFFMSSYYHSDTLTYYNPVLRFK